MIKSLNQYNKNETENGESDIESVVASDDDDDDPTYDLAEETRSAFKTLSIKKNSKARDVRNEDMEDYDDDSVYVDETELDDKDKKCFEIVRNTIQAGQLVKLKVEQCKVYLRKYRLRLTGNKDTLIQRIKEHLEVLDGGGEKKYPVSSFVVNCKGDACTGDIVMFEQIVYDMFNIASRSATGPPCGTRTVAGRIVKESYGAAKQQHTFTIEVLWSKGEKPHPPLHPLLIKGRNLYRLKTLRQRWENEGDRQKALMEKHSRGYVARNDRENRMQEKEIRNNFRNARIPTKGSTTNQTSEEPKENQTRINSGLANNSGNPPLLQPQQSHPFQIRQNSIPPFHQPAPAMTTTRIPSRVQANMKLTQASTNPCRPRAVETKPQQANITLPQASTYPYRPSAVETKPQQANITLPRASTNPYRPSAVETKPQQANITIPQASTNPYRPVAAENTYTRKIQHPETKIHHGSYYHQPATRMSHHFPSSTNMNHPAPLTSRNYPPGTHNKSYYSTYERPIQNQMQRQNMNHPAPLTSRNYPPGTHNKSYYSTYERPIQNQMQRQPCRYFAQGRCYHGDNCRFLHETVQ